MLFTSFQDSSDKSMTKALSQLQEIEGYVADFRQMYLKNTPQKFSDIEYQLSELANSLQAEIEELRLDD